MTAKEALVFITGFFNRKLTPEAQTYYVRVLTAIREPMIDRVVRAIVETSRHFPTPRELQTVSRELQAEARRRCARKEQPLSQPVLPKANPEYARAGFQVLARLVHERPGPAARAEAFAEMARRWPGCGWEEATAATEAQSR